MITLSKRLHPSPSSLTKLLNFVNTYFELCNRESCHLTAMMLKPICIHLMCLLHPKKVKKHLLTLLQAINLLIRKSVPEAQTFKFH